jgi:hypothetical protein
VVLVGDLYTKGPDPVGVWRLIQSCGARGVLGNHDARLIAWLAGWRPHDHGAARVCALLDEEGEGWRTHLQALPLYLRVGRYIVTHAALHPSEGLGGTDRHMHLYGRRWPDDDRADNPFWWQIYEGEPVIYGHDAARGCVCRDRDGEPWIIGLDSGCVYGGQLSGWIVEQERLVQVQARKVYTAVR